MIYRDAPLGQYFFKITVRNGIADVEEHRVQGYGLRIVHAPEIDHANRLLPTPWQCSHFHEQPGSRNFATQLIVQRTGYRRKLVRSVLRGQRCDVFLVRQKLARGLAPLARQPLEARLAQCIGALARMREKGFHGQMGVVSEWGAAPMAGRKG